MLNKFFLEYLHGKNIVYLFTCLCKSSNSVYLLSTVWRLPDTHTSTRNTCQSNFNIPWYWQKTTHTNSKFITECYLKTIICGKILCVLFEFICTSARCFTNIIYDYGDTWSITFTWLSFYPSLTVKVSSSSLTFRKLGTETRINIFFRLVYILDNCGHSLGDFLVYYTMLDFRSEEFTLALSRGGNKAILSISRSYLPVISKRFHHGRVQLFNS